MSITLNDNIFNKSPKDQNDKTGVFQSGVWRPWNNIAEALASDKLTYRNRGLTIYILKDGQLTEYWWRDGILDNQLVEKKLSTIDYYVPGSIVPKFSFYAYQVNNTTYLFQSLVDNNNQPPSNDMINWKAIGLFHMDIKENLFISNGLNLYFVADPNSPDQDSGDIVWTYIDEEGNFVEKSRILTAPAGDKRVIIQFDADEDQQYEIIHANNIDEYIDVDLNLQDVTEAEKGITTNSIELRADTDYSQYSIGQRFISIESDSNGSTNPVGPFKGWPLLIADALNVTLINHSVGSRNLQEVTTGDNSVHANMADFTTYIDPISTPAYIFLIGTNDIRKPIGSVYQTPAFITQYNECIDRLINVLGWPANRIFICSMPYSEESTNTITRGPNYKVAIETVAQTWGVNYIDLFTLFQNNYIDSTIDNIHYSADKGHPMVAKAIIEALPDEYYNTQDIKLNTQGTINTNALNVFRDLNVGGNTFLHDTWLRGRQRFQLGSKTFGAIQSDEILTGNDWILTQGWSGDFITGFTHTSGADITPLTKTVPITVGTSYLVKFIITNRTTGSIDVSLGGVALGTQTSGTLTLAPKAETTGDLIITPTATFNGTVYVSIKILSLYGAIISGGGPGSTTFDNLQLRVASGDIFLGSGAVGSLAVGGAFGGGGNTGIGGDTLASITTATNTSAFGKEAYTNFVYGRGNSGLGYQTFRDFLYGDYNGGFGYQSGLNLVRGSNNLFAGYRAGLGILTGDYNTILGGIYSGLGTALSNQVIIGDGQNRQVISINAITDRGQRKFLATPTGATGAFSSRSIDNLDLPVIDAIHGGTGTATYAIGDLLYASTTTALSKRAAVATGNVLISQGVGVAPIWNKVTSAHIDSSIELTANKQNSLLTDGTGVKYVTVDAVNDGLASIGKNNANAYYEKVRLGTPVTIACEGTSITYGQDGSGTTPAINGSTNLRSDYPYPETMSSVLTSIGIANTVINRGYPGDQTSDWFTRWNAASAVDAVILEYAANDANNYGGKAGIININLFKANMIAIIKKHLNQGAYVVISLPTSDPTYTNDLKVRLYGQVLQELAEQYNLGIIDPKEIMSWIGNIYLSKSSPHLNSTALAEWGSQAAGLFTDRGKTPFNISGSEKYSAYNGLLGTYGESVASANSIYGNFINIPANGYRYMVINVKQKVTMYLKVRSASGTRVLTVNYGANISKTDQVINVTTSTVRQNSLTLDQGLRLIIFKGGTTAPYIDEIGFEYTGAEKIGIGTNSPATSALASFTNPTTLESVDLNGNQVKFVQPNSVSPANQKNLYITSIPNATFGNILAISSRTDTDVFSSAYVNIFQSGKMSVGKSATTMVPDAVVTAEASSSENKQFNARSFPGYKVLNNGLVGQYSISSAPEPPVTPYIVAPGFAVASIKAIATQLHSATAGGTRFDFFITPNNSIVEQIGASLSEFGLDIIGKATVSIAPTNPTDVVRKLELDLKADITGSIQNTTILQANSNFNISGVGRAQDLNIRNRILFTDNPNILGGQIGNDGSNAGQAKTLQLRIGTGNAVINGISISPNVGPIVFGYGGFWNASFGDPLMGGDLLNSVGGAGQRYFVMDSSANIVTSSIVGGGIGNNNGITIFNSLSLYGGSGSGTNGGGRPIHIRGGAATGSGATGDIIFYYQAPGGSGTTLNNVTTEAVRLIGNTGKLTVAVAPTNPNDVVRKTELDLKANLPNTPVTVTTTTQQATVNTKYITNNAALVTITLPLDVNANIGDQVAIRGLGAGLWRLAQNALQVIHGASDTTVGTAGYLQAQSRYDTVVVEKITTNEWSIVANRGTLTIA